MIDGPINGILFQLYVEQVLAQTLRPGDVVVLDNLGNAPGLRVSVLFPANGELAAGVSSATSASPPSA